MISEIKNVKIRLKDTKKAFLKCGWQELINTLTNDPVLQLHCY
jgi:hypothetical protein